MKIKFATYLSVLLVSSMAFAQTQNVTNANISTLNESEPASAVEGFHVALIKPQMAAQVNLKINTFVAAAAKALSTSTNNMGVNDVPTSALGVSGGYASLPIQSLGYTTNLAYFQLKDSNTTLAVGRLDGNLAYAYDKNFSVKGGINISRFTSGDIYKDLSPGLGYQASLGYQINKRVGVDVGYSESNMSGTSYDNKYLYSYNMDVKLSGYEVGLVASF